MSLCVSVGEICNVSEGVESTPFNRDAKGVGFSFYKGLCLTSPLGFTVQHVVSSCGLSNTQVRDDLVNFQPLLSRW